MKAEKRFEEAYRLYRELMAMGENDAELHLIGGQVAKASGNLFAARIALEYALEAEPTGRILGLVRFVYGEVLRQIGEISAALVQMDRWFEDLLDYAELIPLLLGSAHYNRALALRQAKRYEESLAGYALACDHYRNEGMKRMLCEALHNRAWVACLVQNETIARSALDEARVLCDSNYLRWHQKMGEAFMEAITRDPLDDSYASLHKRQAVELCEVIMSHKGDDVPLDVRSHACWLAGRIGLALGTIIAADGLAQQAVHYGAAASNENRCLYDAAELLREIRLIHLPEQPQGA